MSQSQNNDKSLIFNFEGNDFRVIKIDSGTICVAKDLSQILGYRNVHDLTRHLDEDEKGKHLVLTHGGPQMMVVVTRAGLFKSILRRETDQIPDPAIREKIRRFQRYVTHVVLPQIGDTGGFIPISQNDDEKTILSKAFIIAKRTIDRLQQANAEQSELIEAQKPKVLFADTWKASKESILIGEAAKVLQHKFHLNIGQNRLFKLLRRAGYLCSRKGDEYNSPSERATEMKLFDRKSQTINLPDGSTRATFTTKLTYDGQVWMFKHAEKHDGIFANVPYARGFEAA